MLLRLLRVVEPEKETEKDADGAEDSEHEPEDDMLLWTFASLWDVNDKVDQVLLRTQTSAIHTWLDSMKSMDMVDAAIAKMMELPLLRDFEQQCGALRQAVHWHESIGRAFCLLLKLATSFMVAVLDLPDTDTDARCNLHSSSP